MSNSGPHGDVGTGWVAEPEHWSALAPGDVLELGGRLVMFVRTGVTVAEPGDTDAVPGRGYRWLWTCTVDANGAQSAHIWAPESDPDPLAMVLRPRDVLVGEVIEPG